MYGCGETAQRTKPFSLCQFHCLIAHCGVRHGIHIFQLIHAHPQNIADDRFHFVYLHFGEPIDDIVKLDHVLDGSLRYSRDKGSLFFFQILILIEHGTDHKMAVTALFCHFHQDPEDQFSRIDRISHGLFLQITVPDAVTVK